MLTGEWKKVKLGDLPVLGAVFIFNSPKLSGLLKTLITDISYTWKL